MLAELDEATAQVGRIRKLAFPSKPARLPTGPSCVVFGQGAAQIRALTRTVVVKTGQTPAVTTTPWVEPRNSSATAPITTTIRVHRFEPNLFNKRCAALPNTAWGRDSCECRELAAVGGVLVRQDDGS